MDNINSQIEDVTQRLDDNDTSLQDFSDSLDSSITDIQSSIDDQAQSIETLDENSGQLTFPLTQDTIDLIKEQFPTGTVKLVGGVGNITDARISVNSNIFLSNRTPSGFTTTPAYYYLAGSGGVIISSTDAGDTSIISYFIAS